MSESSLRKYPHMETAALIAAVRLRPCLWDRSDVDYRNRQRKEAAWADILTHLDPTYHHMSAADKRELGSVITRKWYNVRDCYKKSRFGPRGSAAGRPYMYADRLTFLDAVYHPTNRKKGGFDNSIGEHDETEEHDEEWLNEVFVPDIESTDQESGPSVAKKPKLEYTRSKDNTDAEDGVVSVLLNLIEKEEDEDRAFFKSITPAVKSLCDDDKLVFRIQVMKLLTSLKNKHRRHVKRERESLESDTD